jgi:hypothetical protein
MQVWEVKVIDQADFDAKLFCELFADEAVALDVGEEQLKSYREDQDEEFKNSIVLRVVPRTLHSVDTGKKGN